MNQRKIWMLEKALELFAKKGYNKTSIQDITDAWGISKGAFYSNFSSKEELMLSIMKHYTVLGFKEIQNVTTGGSEKEIFIEQIRVQFSIIDSHREFLRIQFTEGPQMTEELKRYVFETRGRMFKWYMKRLSEVYGQKINPYILDCVILLTSMIHGYMSLIILDQKPLAFDKTARFLINRLDSIVKELRGDSLLTKEIMTDFLQIDDKIGPVQNSINLLRMGLSDAPESIISSLNMLETELVNGHPREFMVEALLLYLKKQSYDQIWESAQLNLEMEISNLIQSR